MAKPDIHAAWNYHKATKHSRKARWAIKPA
jgi:hypothetical protein